SFSTIRWPLSAKICYFQHFVIFLRFLVLLTRIASVYDLDRFQSHFDHILITCSHYRTPPPTPATKVEASFHIYPAFGPSSPLPGGRPCPQRHHDMLASNTATYRHPDSTGPLPDAGNALAPAA